MKTTKTILPAALIFAALTGLSAYAQNEAIPGWQDVFSGGGGGGGIYSSNVAAYVNGGAGFAFSPHTTIAITALGFGWPGASATPSQVSLFDASGNQLATATITASDPFYNQTYYQSIASLDLIAGDIYYLQAASPNGSGGYTWVGDVSSSFSVNSAITFVSASYGGFVPSSGTPASPLTQENEPFYYEAPNFEFVTVPEPSIFCLGAVGLFAMLLRRKV